jgi:hypothetical protein
MHFRPMPTSANDLSVLHGTLNRWCQQSRMEIKDPRAEGAAAEFIDWFHTSAEQLNGSAIEGVNA